jgi:3-dehydrosphinganine reductase
VYAATRRICATVRGDVANWRGSFRGRHALVTGGSSGIGRALALALVQGGAHVGILARGHERLAAVRRELEQPARPGQRVAAVAADVADATQTERAVAECAAALGGLDLLVNDAGIALARRAADTSLADYRRLLEVDFLGTVHVTQAALPHLLAAGRAALVNVSSLAALLPIAGYAAYAPAKAALTAWSEVLRQELAPRGIRVTVVFPPDTDTPQLAEENREKPPETRALAGGAGLLSAEAVASAILRGVARGKATIVPGASSRAVATLARLFPGIVRRVIDRELAQAALRAARSEP